MQRLFWALRSLIYLLFLTLTVIPYAVAVLVVSLFIGGSRLYWFTIGWLRLSIWGARVICGVKHRMHGLHNLQRADTAGPVIVLPKHQSTWETFAFTFLLQHPLCYVFKRELLLIPFFGWAMARLDMIHIDRSKRAEAWSRVAEQGRRYMAQGNWVIMFPEGTRTPRGSQGMYKIGGTRLAVATGAAVLPIAVTSARCWPRKSFLLRPGTIDVSVGPLIASEGRAPDELMREVETWIEAEMRRLDPEAYVQAPATGT